MMKTLAAATLAAALTGIANAGTLPAPPMQAYTAPADTACDSQTLNIYFPAGQSDMTGAAEALLTAVKSNLEGCVIGPIAIEARAIDAASPDQAEALATARLEKVQSVLQDADMTGTQMKASIADVAAQPATHSPLDRKVEIRVAAWAPEIS